MCVYGDVNVWKQLLSEGYQISLNTVSKYRKEMGIKAILICFCYNNSENFTLLKDRKLTITNLKQDLRN